MSCLIKAVLALLIVSVWNIASPGVIITVPFPLSPPTVSLPLPFSINDVVVSNLQLTKVELREVDYSWKLFAPRAEVNVSRAVVSFDWFYKKDSGKGFFIENQLELVFDWNFTTTKESRFQIAVTSTKITPGLMKVELGGGVVETVVVEVTNLILNKASAIFRGIIANKLSSAITDSSSIFGKDVQLYHDKTHNKNIKLNTTLVAAPIISNSTLLLQMNAAPYIQGQASGFLNPPDILVKAKSSKIQLQVHKLLFTRILELVLKVRGGLFVELESTSITTVIDIDSLALSPIFPQMGFYPINKDVVFSVAIPTVAFDFSGQHFQVKVRGQVTISTQGKTDKARTLYMSPINASASIELSLLFSEMGSSSRLQKLEVIGFTPEKQDVDNVLIVPEALSKYFPQLMDWIKQAGNFELNRRLVRLQYQGIKVVLGGKVLNEHAYNIEVDLI